MSAWELPTSLDLGGVGYKIRTDFRDILFILDTMSDPEYEDDEKATIALIVFYEDYERIPAELCHEALKKVFEFIDGGERADDSKQHHPKLMDWTQDAALIIPAVNRVIGKEVRAEKYLHWWTFLAAYSEIGDCQFSSILGIRSKKAKHKKLEKYEQEFYQENKALIDLRSSNSSMSEREREDLLRIIRGNG